MLKQEGKGSLVVLLLAERARSEGARSTRAIEDRPGYPFEKDIGNLEDAQSGGQSRLHTSSIENSGGGEI